MSVNIRDYVSSDHIESIGEIAKSQSSIIQALSIDNSKLQQENEQLHSIIKEVRGIIKSCKEYGSGINIDYILEILDKEVN